MAGTVEPAARATPGAHWVAADVTDRASLGGIDVLISAVATASPLGRNKPERVDYLGNLNLARAAKAAGVRRIAAQHRAVQDVCRVTENRGPRRIP